ncbi:hypothetical protein BC832DRAFT_589591 [Gaertneriomyces semiglobifer]|nr:hypothetical protein BC832DRAFT_589591 [Gaertneriomyces semiglobifer]
MASRTLDALRIFGRKKDDGARSPTSPTAPPTPAEQGSVTTREDETYMTPSEGLEHEVGLQSAGASAAGGGVGGKLVVQTTEVIAPISGAPSDVASLQNEISKHLQERRKLEDELTALQQRLGAIEQKKKFETERSLQQQKESSAVKISKLEGELHDALEQCRLLQDQVSALAAEKDARKTKYDQAEEDLNNVRAMLRDRDKQIDLMAAERRQIDSKQACLSQELTKLRAAERLTAAEQHRDEDAQIQLTALTTNLEQAKARSNSMELELNGLRTAVAERDKRVASLQARLGDAQETQEKQTAALNTEQQQYNLCVAELGPFRGRLTNIIRAIENKRDQDLRRNREVQHYIAELMELVLQGQKDLQLAAGHLGVLTEELDRTHPVEHVLSRTIASEETAAIKGKQTMTRRSMDLPVLSESSHHGTLNELVQSAEAARRASLSAPTRQTLATEQSPPLRERPHSSQTFGTATTSAAQPGGHGAIKPWYDDRFDVGKT